jgi:hypothetical protein
MIKKLILGLLISSLHLRNSFATSCGLGKVAASFTTCSIVQLGTFVTISFVERYLTSLRKGCSGQEQRTMSLLVYSDALLCASFVQFDLACKPSYDSCAEGVGAAASLAVSAYLYKKYKKEPIKRILGIITFPFCYFE